MAKQILPLSLNAFNSIHKLNGVPQKTTFIPFPHIDRRFLTPLQQTTFWKHSDKRRNCSNEQFLLLPQCFPLLVIDYPFNYRDFPFFDKISSSRLLRKCFMRERVKNRFQQFFIVISLSNQITSPCVSWLSPTSYPTYTRLAAFPHKLLAHWRKTNYARRIHFCPTSEKKIVAELWFNLTTTSIDNPLRHRLNHWGSALHV